jgi:ATP-dependent Clp protease ATP-binding subunit ClpB
LVVFHPLESKHIRKIVDIQLQYLHQRLGEQDLELVLSDEAGDRLAEAGYDPVYGARPLKRAIQQQLENPLAEGILNGDFEPGDTIEISVSDDHLNFSKEEAEQTAA